MSIRDTSVDDPVKMDDIPTMKLATEHIQGVAQKYGYDEGEIYPSFCLLQQGTICNVQKGG